MNAKTNIPGDFENLLKNPDFSIKRYLLTKKTPKKNSGSPITNTPKIKKTK